MSETMVSGETRGPAEPHLDHEVIVIGAGLIGAAAARHLSEAGLQVTLIGPDEPAEPDRHEGVFASHYDQGRLTRLIGRDPIYSKLAEHAIAEYAALESASGVTFHHPVGSLVVDIVDARTRQELWRGSVQILTDPTLDEELARQRAPLAIERLLSQFREAP